MKPTIVADEMFPEGAGFMDLEEAGGSSGILMDLATSEKHVHADFFNSFDDIFDEDEETLPLNSSPPPPPPLVQQIQPLVPVAQQNLSVRPNNDVQFQQPQQSSQ